MNKISYILLCFLMFCINSYAQQNKTIINELNTYRQGQGRVVIYQEDIVDKMLGNNVITSNKNLNTQLSNEKTEAEVAVNATTETKFVKAKGYRIQVYSGNDQKKSKDVAAARRSEIKSTYPNMDVSVTYTSPVWRVRAGNFKSRTEAEKALKEMKSQFTSFGKEMHIVDDVIKVYVN